LLFEVLDALAAVWEPGRIAVRLAPFASVNDVFDSAPMAHSTPLIERLNTHGLA
jgi:N-ethylmaleimide reductase